MAQVRRRTRAVTWDPAVLPGPVRVGRGRRQVRLELVAVGRDLLLVVAGGQGHAGAVALAGPGGAPAVPAGPLVLPPHREGPLVAECAALVAAAAGCACAGVAGIHQDAADRQEITALVANARTGARRLAAALAAVPAPQRYCSARLPKPRTP